MKANELRIGNWVMGDLKKPYQFELSDFSDWYNEHNSHEFGNYIYPIPLTEEWLLKFGFEKVKEKFIGGTYRYVYYVYEHDIIIMDDFNGCYLNSCKIENLQYVHQLQNLYFALTGKELTILNTL